MPNRTPESRLSLDAPHHIAVVGAGFTGTSVLVQLCTAAIPVRTVTVFERGTDPGPGYPYRRDESEDYLINNTADSMSLDPREPSAFVEWLGGRPDLVSAFDPKAHLPRRWFGEYLHHEHQRALRALADAGIRIEVVSEEVIDIEPLHDFVTPL